MTDGSVDNPAATSLSRARHDLIGVFNIISGFAELLETDLQLEAESAPAGYLRQIRNATERGLMLVRTIGREEPADDQHADSASATEA